jgi:hypothetical protein
VLDLIAASGGRVFAKEANTDRFFFARLDEMYVHARADGVEFTVPPNYFKIDPEYHQPNTPNRRADLLAHLQGDYSGHPAGERYTAFRLALDLGLMNAMVVRFERLRWHLVDMRPPLPLPPPETSDVPGFVPGYMHLVYHTNEVFNVPLVPDFTLYSIDFWRVLDIGVGHVHHHEQYECITGGEMQPLRMPKATTYNASSTGMPRSLQGLLWGQVISAGAKIFPWDTQKTYADGYRIFNGPVRDGDGFVDGTCNLYVLAQLRPDAYITTDRYSWRGGYGILFTDEQSLFSGRWRLVHPEDYKNGGFALANDLHSDETRPIGQKIYEFDKDKYWCPMRSGCVGPRSRLAVAAQVLLVNGESADGEPLLYSINYSFSTMDRSWRWRRLPRPARYFDGTSFGNPTFPPVSGDEQVPPGPDECVFPQTIRLREDMTICIKGRGPGADGGVVVGTWLQRYLPADNRPVPPPGELIAGQAPPRGYEHPWRFLPEAVFNRADQFSHFGVYADVDSRTQYYLVMPMTPADGQTLASQPGPWVDDRNQLFIDCMKFPWDSFRIRPIDYSHTSPLLEFFGKSPFAANWAPLPENLHVGSLFNGRAQLRMVRRGTRWIALHHDKRDDDLLEYQGIPIQVSLANGSQRVQLILTSRRWVEQPPAVSAVYVWWEGADAIAVAFVTTGQEPVADNVWRLRMAGFAEPVASGSVAWLLDVTNDGSFTEVGFGVYKHRRTLAGAELDRMRAYASPAGALRYGTSVWLEDIVGHVAPPQEIRWLQAATVNWTSSRTAIPLGLPVALTVNAFDPISGAGKRGRVKINGVEIGDTGVTIGPMFNNTVETIETPTGPKTFETPPLCTVAVAGYLETRLPFTFYTSNAAFVSQSVPAVMLVGRRYNVSVTMRNTSTGAGAGTWTRDSATPFRLGSEYPRDNFNWGFHRVELPNPVPPGQNVMFSFTVTAPATPGPWHFQWRMLEEAVQWFGAFTADVVVNVQLPTMITSVSPSPITAGRYVDVLVTAVDSSTGAPVNGTVNIAGYPSKPTGQPVTVYIVDSYPAATVTAPGYAGAAVSWPPLVMYSTGSTGSTGSRFGIGGSQL